MNAWASIPALGAGVGHDTQEGVRQALLQNPVFSYGVFEPIETTQVAAATGVAANIAQNTIPLSKFLTVPQNLAGVQYLVGVASTATGVGTILGIQHKQGGGNVIIVESQVLNVEAWGVGTVAGNGGQMTFGATKGSATAYSYEIYVTGFFRSY